MTIRPPGRRSPGPAARPQRPAALRPGARPGGGIRRTKPVKRRSAGLTPVRAAAGLALLVGFGALWGAVSSGMFNAERMTISGNTWTSDDAVIAALALPSGQNVFAIRTGDLEARVATLPSISRASVSVSLPDEVRITVTEREPLLVWKIGSHRYLVDGDGKLFGEVGVGDTPDSAAAAALPVVEDRRAASMVMGVGSTLDPITLDAALRLGALRPVDVGSAGTGLRLRVDDTNGFTIRGDPLDWTGIFGFYTPTLRTTELIPGQVRLLRSLILGHGEDEVLRVILADDRSGTWVPRATPAPSASPKP